MTAPGTTAATAAAPETVHDVVNAILGENDNTSSFIATRYPSTYARDFFRSHVDRITGMRHDGSDAMPSRSEAGPMIQAYAQRTGQGYGTVMLAVADAYLAEYDVRVSQVVRNQALEAYFEAHPAEAKRYGLD